MYLGRLGFGPSVELPAPGVPPPSTVSPSRQFYAATQSSYYSALATDQTMPRTYSAAVMAVAPAPGAGGLDVTRQIGETNVFGPGGRGGSGRSGSSEATYETTDEMTDAETAQAVDEAMRADAADTIMPDGSGTPSWLPEVQQQAQSFFSKYRTPLLIGGVLLGGLVVWRLLR